MKCNEPASQPASQPAMGTIRSGPIPCSCIAHCTGILFTTLLLTLWLVQWVTHNLDQINGLRSRQSAPTVFVNVWVPSAAVRRHTWLCAARRRNKGNNKSSIKVVVLHCCNKTSVCSVCVFLSGSLVFWNTVKHCHLVARYSSCKGVRTGTRVGPGTLLFLISLILRWCFFSYIVCNRLITFRRFKLLFILTFCHAPFFFHVYLALCVNQSVSSFVLIIGTEMGRKIESVQVSKNLYLYFNVYILILCTLHLIIMSIISDRCIDVSSVFTWKN